MSWHVQEHYGLNTSPPNLFVGALTSQYNSLWKMIWIRWGHEGGLRMWPSFIIHHHLSSPALWQAWTPRRPGVSHRWRNRIVACTWEFAHESGIAVTWNCSKHSAEWQRIKHRQKSSHQPAIHTDHGRRRVGLQGGAHLPPPGQPPVLLTFCELEIWKPRWQRKWTSIRTDEPGSMGSLTVSKALSPAYSP